jgi:TIR domain
MKPAWRYTAIGAAGTMLAVLWPLSPALSPRESLQARLVCVLLTGVACTAIALAKRLRPLVWMAVAIGSGVGGVGVLLVHFDANATCVAAFDNRSIVIGREYTPVGADYASKNPGLSASDILLDVAGAADRIWTPESIASCRFWMSWGGLLAVPLFAACVGILIASRGYRFTAAPAPSPTARSPGAVRAPVYDAFLSYRHGPPDETYAKEVAEALEAGGLRLAVDFRDFGPNEHFLSEMERCIKDSRFVLCVVTPRYLDSDHCSEEAIICKTLDMADRRKRLVPLVFERVELPVWLHGLVGIDFSPSASVDPLERLQQLLKTTPNAA